jgi:carbon-monoxide dehydrogenase medium subunit
VQEFTFHRPASVAEAVAVLRENEDAKLLSGGQSLLPMMKLDLALPSDLVSLSGIEELVYVRREGDAVVVGAATTHAAVAGSADAAAIPALAALAGAIGDPQVRNRGTLGGSIAHADPAADYPAALVGLGARVRTDRREIGADDFFRGIYETALEADELIESVSFPIPAAAAYEKFPHPASRFALVGVFVAKAADGVRVAVAGVGSSVFRATPFEQALSADFSEGALSGLEAGGPRIRDDVDASAAYRRHLIGVLARRAVARCG